MRQMTITRPTAAPATAQRGRVAARWLLTFAGFPLGGLGRYVTGPVDDTAAAVFGGLLTGAVLGAVQAWGLGADRPTTWRWILATSLGLAVGLGLGATSVGFATSLLALVAQGAVCGVAVGAAQAFVLRPRLGRTSLAWPLLLGAAWAAGWAVSTAVIGGHVDERFTVFGSSGALLVTVLTVVLPLRLRLRPARSAAEVRTS